jgi:5-methyltetrahydropteroyltriglutamate--homocysteine methyltransferase
LAENGALVISVHTDVVGSLLRPPELLKARDDYAAGSITPAEFKAVEDRAVDAAVKLQEDAGLDVVTDGEMRRLSFQSALTDSVDGFGDVPLEAFLWGEWYSDVLGEMNVERPAELGVSSKLKWRHHLAAEDFTYLRSRATRIPKVTLTSPSLYANLWSKERSGDVYPTLDDFLADIVDIYRGEVAELQRLGCRYIQLDAPHYPLLIEPKWRSFYESRGWSVDRWLSHGIELDNAVVAGHNGVTFSMHLCRGNQVSRWLVTGDYEPIARQIFQNVAVHRLLLEYDDERSGSFEPLRHMPDDKMVILGLVTTKTPRRETVAELSDRIAQAARFVGLERLGLSPQCGFATSIIGNAITVEDEYAKLTTIVQTARKVWG